MKAVTQKWNEKRKGGVSILGTTALIVSLGFLSVLALIAVHRQAHAAVPKTTIGAFKAKAGDLGYACPDRLSSLYLSGSFLMPGNGEQMNLWVGKPGWEQKTPNEVWGVVGKSSGGECEAVCKVTRFERFQKDLQPALMELDCEGMRIKTLRMPVHVQWVREKNRFQTVLRMGSSIYGMEEAKLRIQVNRYEVASK
ncbi:MAG: hypothetical protein AB1540_05655 [Bdellovibrionota bacterium]